MRKFVWCEDGGAGFEFWRLVFAELFPDCVVQSKKNNTELRKAVSQVEEDGNQYYVLMDLAVDNPSVLRELTRLKRDISVKQNVSAIKIHSFEFVLLSFMFLEDWVFAAEDDLKEARKELLEQRKQFIRWVNGDGDVSELRKISEILSSHKSYNSEQIAAKLLYAITRNTGFETDKGSLGKCFCVDCCGWVERQEDDICGLDSERPYLSEKVCRIYRNSVLKEAFREVGLSYDNRL